MPRRSMSPGIWPGSAGGAAPLDSAGRGVLSCVLFTVQRVRLRPCGAPRPGPTRASCIGSREHSGMRKVDIVRRVAEDTGCTTLEAAAAMDAILTTVKEGFQQGEAVILRRFGTLSCPGQTRQRGPEPADRRPRRHGGPAGRALHGQPDLEAGGGRDGDHDDMSRHASLWGAVSLASGSCWHAAQTPISPPVMRKIVAAVRLLCDPTTLTGSPVEIRLVHPWLR